MNEQFIHLLHHILQIMVDGREVQREEAVPKWKSGEEGYSFPHQPLLPGNAIELLFPRVVGVREHSSRHSWQTGCPHGGSLQIGMDRRGRTEV